MNLYFIKNEYIMATVFWNGTALTKGITFNALGGQTVKIELRMSFKYYLDHGTLLPVATVV